MTTSNMNNTIDNAVKELLNKALEEIELVLNSDALSFKSLKN